MDEPTRGVIFFVWRGRQRTVVFALLLLRVVAWRVCHPLNEAKHGKYHGRHGGAENTKSDDEYGLPLASLVVLGIMAPLHA